MADRLLIGPPSQRVFCRPPAIGHQPPGVSTALKVPRQFRCDLMRPRPIAGLLAGPDLLMQAYPVPSRDARIHHLVIQGMAERIARRDRPVRPGLGATGP